MIRPRGLLEHLETRIPPPVWLLLHILALIALDATLPAPRWGAMDTGLWPVLLLAALALLLDASALLAFVRAGTTVNPLTPARASRLVTGGVYRWSRNPMYLGLVLWFAAFGLWWQSLWLLPLLVLFVGVLTRLQILPEERALAARFGDQWRDWARRVRRWI